MIKVEKEMVKKWIAERLTIERGYISPPNVEMLNDGSIVVIKKGQSLPVDSVSNSLDLMELERKIDEALESETIDSLKEWLQSKR